MQLKKMRGMKVIKDGTCIGRVVQGCLCDSLRMLDGFWIDRAFSGIRFICADHICIIGSNSVIVDHPGEHLRMKPQTLLIRAVSTDGNRIGAAVDAIIDKNTLAVKKLIISPGWIDMLYKGCIYAENYNFDPSIARVIISQYETEVET